MMNSSKYGKVEYVNILTWSWCDGGPGAARAAWAEACRRARAARAASSAPTWAAPRRIWAP